MSAGLYGKVLRVNLTDRTVRTDQFSEADARKYLGGGGLAARILFEETTGREEPLGPDNVVCFISGLLTGLPVPSACKSSLCARSPLTGIWGEATVGGFWGSKLKRTGYDGLVITGRAPSPVYLWVTEAGCEVKPAERLWGLDTYATSEALTGETDARAEVAAIGPAGEKQVLVSGVMVGGKRTRAAGRCGLGAVWGSKNLKAIAVHGNKHREPARPAELKDAVKRIRKDLSEKTRRLGEFGTAAGMETQEIFGDVPLKNFAASRWPEGIKKISGPAMVDSMFERHYACFGCPVACGKEIRIRKGPHAGTTAHAPEYETLVGFGSLCLNEDLDTITVANDLCNRYGIDTISSGSAIAFAMEAYEKGIITDADVGPRGLRWGDGEAVVDVVEKIGRKEGIGVLLGEGIRRAGEKLGLQSAQFAHEVKGLEMSYHDPRANTGMALSYATANRGGDHLDALTFYVEMASGIPDMGYEDGLDPHVSEGKAKLVFELQNLLATFNSLGLCKFILRGIGPIHVVEWVRGAMGWDMTRDELFRAGERVFNLKRCYNARLGVSRKDDTLPPRLLAQARDDGDAKGVLPDLERMLGEFYRLRGWSDDGIPARETLERLGLSKAAEALHGGGA